MPLWRLSSSLRQACWLIGKEVNSTIPHEECWWGAHLPNLGREPVGGIPRRPKPVTHGQCDAVAGHRCPATGTKLYCLVTEVHSTRV